jgi:hypothetical protein
LLTASAQLKSRDELPLNPIPGAAKVGKITNSAVEPLLWYAKPSELVWLPA